MAVPTQDELLAQVATLSKVLDGRCGTHDRLVPYDEGGCPIPDAVVRAKVTRAYRSLMPTAEAPWGSLVVDAVQDRLEVVGIKDQNQAAADAVWGVWQDNQMDAESKLAHRSALLDGRAFALVWPGGDGQPQISLDDCTQMAVQYREGSRRVRLAALRRWREGDKRYATLYRPEAIYKFQSEGAPEAENPRWVRRPVEGEDWPLENPYGVVPVVEVPVNRKLKPGSFGYARGEYEHCTGLIDRINLLTFLGLVVAFWMGFPFRVVIGDRILKDDEGQPLPPFEAMADSVGQFENPATKLEQFDAADRSLLSIGAELDQLAAVTKTPRHYFPIGTSITNIAEPTIRAFEGGLIAKVHGHAATVGEGWEELLRVSGLMLPEPVELSSRAELQWGDFESRSLAERGDAASKLATILPKQAIIEKVLNVAPDVAAKYAAQGAIADLMAAARQPVPNGNGVPVGQPPG